MLYTYLPFPGQMEAMNSRAWMTKVNIIPGKRVEDRDCAFKNHLNWSIVIVETFSL